jgi:dTDP-4-dehydrorhamnose reductase
MGASKHDVNMRVLTAGWHGQVAHALSALLATRTDVSAYAVGRPALDLATVPGVARTLFDIAPDVVINAAAYTNVDGAEDEPERARRHNAAGAAGLAAYAAKRGIPIIHLSSAYVFDGHQSRPYVESDPPQPSNAYGRSKLDSEQAIATANPRHIVLRTAWLYSPYGSNFVSTMLDRARSESAIDVVADQYGTPTYAAHLADAILGIATMVVDTPSAAYWGTYHAAGSGRASWFDIASHAFRASAALGGPTAAAHPISSANYPTRAARLANSQLDCTRLREVFGIELPDWRTGVDDCVRQLLGQST